MGEGRVLSPLLEELGQIANFLSPFPKSALLPLCEQWGVAGVPRAQGSTRSAAWICERRQRC